MYFKILGRYLSAGKSVLEYGAGYGYLSKRISQKFDSFAYDISKHSRNKIRDVSPKTQVLEKLSQIKKHKFDGIICLHTLEHINDPAETVKLFNESLNSKGVVVAVMPDTEGMGHKIKKDNWFAYKDKTHISLLGGEEWVNIFKKEGFTVIKTGSDWFWDPPYLPLIPVLLQKLIFFPGCLVMVVLGRIIYPQGWGEDLVIVDKLFSPKLPCPIS